MTALLLFTPLVILALGVAFLLPRLARVYTRCEIEEITPDWLENFSTSYYESMGGLLGAEDFAFLSRQPGFDLSLYRKLRRERLHIFRQYLVRLIRDFNRLHYAARLLIAHRAQDRSDLLSKLLWLKLRFSVAVMRAELSYVFCCLGLRSLAVRALILNLEEMHAQLKAISAPQPAVA